MRQFIRDCRECWIVAIFVFVLLLANGARLVLDVRNHTYNMPMVMRLLDVLHLKE